MERNPDHDLFHRLREKLDHKHVEGSYRSLLSTPTDSDDTSLHKTEPMVDFASNDYLGLAHCPNQLALVRQSFDAYTRSCIPETKQGQTQFTSQAVLGATGSRLLSGDSVHIRQLEHHLARVHKRPRALLCNSGYDANLSVLSSLPIEGDFIVADCLVHNSLIMGVRMGRVNKSDFYTFEHNNVADLNRVLSSLHSIRSSTSNIGKLARREIFIVIESVYSMDGDVAPMQVILDLALEYGAHVIIDEAHGFGIFGSNNAHDMMLDYQPLIQSTQNEHDTYQKRAGLGVVAALGLENHKALLASVYTFGKAAGCHGAVIVSSDLVIEYLINYARPFIYSTGLPPHSVVTIRCSYSTIMSKEGDSRRQTLFGLVRFFRQEFISGLQKQLQIPSNALKSILVTSPSPIQAVFCRGNDTCIQWAQVLRKNGIKVFPIRFPTVEKGSERIRIVLHYYNTEEQILVLVQTLIYLISLRRNDQKRSKL